LLYIRKLDKKIPKALLKNNYKKELIELIKDKYNKID